MAIAPAIAQEPAILDFENTSTWRSDRVRTTNSIACGNMDADGDLDLVCGNSEQANTLYLNTDGQLEEAETWSSGEENRTTSVALADVDGDGDLDLVCGIAQAPNTLYENRGGVFVFETKTTVARHPCLGCALGRLGK